MAALSSDLREALAKVGTSTLTGVLNRRGLKSMTLFDVWPLRPEQPRLVGIAFTMLLRQTTKHRCSTTLAAVTKLLVTCRVLCWRKGRRYCGGEFQCRIRTRRFTSTFP